MYSQLRLAMNMLLQDSAKLIIFMNQDDDTGLLVWARQIGEDSGRGGSGHDKLTFRLYRWLSCSDILREQYLQVHDVFV